MTLFVPNLLSRLVDRNGLVQKPWNSFFQQFSSQPSKVQAVIVGASPFSYTFGEPGTLVITGGTISQVDLDRGPDTVDYQTDRRIVGMIGDIITITYSVLPTIQFLPFYGAPR